MTKICSSSVTVSIFCWAKQFHEVVPVLAATLLISAIVSIYKISLQETECKAKASIADDCRTLIAQQLSTGKCCSFNVICIKDFSTCTASEQVILAETLKAAPSHAGCDQGCHTYCSPILEEIPLGDWFCSAYSSTAHDMLQVAQNPSYDVHLPKYSPHAMRSSRDMSYRWEFGSPWDPAQAILACTKKQCHCT